MNIANGKRFFLGIFILILLVTSYFIRFDSDYGSNYAVEDSLLGVLIFHNFFVLVLYFLISFLLILTGIKRIRLR
ncbi:MAG: hypothetical protein AABW89_02815 [Nanoarchaeota archaeon]